MSLTHLLRAGFAAALIAVVSVAGTLPAPAHAQAASAPAAASGATPPAPATAADVAAAASAPAGVVSKEAVANPFGLAGMWASSDWVKRGTLVILIIMSMAAWYVTFVKLFEQRSMLNSGAKGLDTFWKASSVKDGVATLEEGSPLRFVAEQGIKAANNHQDSMASMVDKHTWVNQSLDRAVGSIQSRLSSGMALLATVGSTAPFVGLFGTTWGIYDALVKIGLSGQASIDKVAGPVGAALILTAVGLAVAVPAVMGYNWLIRRNKTVMDMTRGFAGDLQNVLLSGKR
jgi:biopolymer transport protein ExbB